MVEHGVRAVGGRLPQKKKAVVVSGRIAVDLSQPAALARPSLGRSCQV